MPMRIHEYIGFIASVLLAGTVAVPPADAQSLPVIPTFVEGNWSFGATHALSGNGQRLVFESSSNITGGNADGNGELFLWDSATGITQLTSTTGTTFYWEADINTDGNVITVVADADITAAGATETELYRWVEGAGWTRLTTTPGATSLVFIGGIGINATGTRIMFTSRGNYSGGNPTNEEQVFLWDSGSGFTQLTNAAPCGMGGGNFGMDLSADGARVLFSSRCQRGTVNTDLQGDLFLWDQATGVTALTDDTIPVGADGSLNENGTVAALRSGNDLVNGGYGSGDHLFRWRDGVGFSQLTTESIERDRPMIDAAGNRIAYVASNGQGIVGMNPEGAPELFLWTASGAVSVTDSAQTDTSFGNEEPDLSDDGRRLSLVALRAFDQPTDSRVGYFVLDIPSAHLESPGQGSSESGIGLIRGWACEAGRIDVLIDSSLSLQLPYGTSRPDTVTVCDDANNGFGGVINWNHLGDGLHEIRAFRDSVEFASATFVVTTLGVEYLTGVAGDFLEANFPDAGRNLTLRWSEPHQNFVFVGTATSAGAPGDTQGNGTAILESPFSGSSESGIGLIRGWACSTTGITVMIDADPAIATSYGAERPDTLAACGDTNNGFGIVVNWNRYPTGAHRLRAFAAGSATPFADVTFNVFNIGVEFLSGVGSPSRSLSGFPTPGSSTHVTWSEPHQGVVITGYTP